MSMTEISAVVIRDQEYQPLRARVLYYIINEEIYYRSWPQKDLQVDQALSVWYGWFVYKNVTNFYWFIIWS